MTVQFVQEGDAIDYRPAADVAAGEVVVQGILVGVTKTAIKAGELGAVAITGVFEFPKEVGAGLDIATGQYVFWDKVNLIATKIGGVDRVLVGWAVADAGENDPTVQAKLFF